jgi:hypothetical protein
MQMKMFTSWGRTYFEINQWLQKKRGHRYGA